MKKNEKSELLNHEKTLQKKETDVIDVIVKQMTHNETSEDE